MIFTASYDNRFATNNKAKRTKNPQYVGNKYQTKSFKTLNGFIKETKIDHYDSTSYGSFFSLDKIWSNIDENKQDNIRPIKINTLGFQLCFIDVDTEYFNNTYIPDYVEKNVQLIKDSDAAFMLKSSSYGSIPKDIDELDKQGNKKYPNGVKSGKRIVWIMDQPIHIDNVRNYFTQEEWDTIYSNVEPYEKYVLINNDKEDYEQTRALAEETTILELMYEYFVIHLAKSIGISDGTQHGFDEHSLTISQKMMGSAQGFIFTNDVRVAHRPILKDAIAYIKNKYNIKKEIKVRTQNIVHTDGSVTEFDPIEFNADVATLITAFVPKRIKGNNTYGQYFQLATALKQLGVDKENIVNLFDDRQEGDNIYNSVRPIFRDATHCLNIIEKIVVKDMGIDIIPSKNHNKNTYKNEVIVNERYLSPLIVENMYKQGNFHLVFQSIHGTGKTQMMKGSLDFFKEMGLTVVYVSHLRSILRTTATKLNLSYYEDNLDTTKGICITPDSFHRLDGMDFTNCVLVIDEHTQVIRKMAGDYMGVKDKNYYKSLQNLWKALETAKMTIALDADDYIGVPEIMKQKPVKIINKYETDKMNLTFFRWAQDEAFEDRIKASKKEYCSRSTHAFETILNLLNDGKKIAIPCSKKSTAKKLHDFLIRNGKQGFCLMSETENKPEAFDNIAFNKVPYQYCIYTYTAWTGFDVSVGYHSIDLVVAIFEGVAGLNHDDMAQSMRRFRGVSNGIVYGQWTASCKLVPWELFIQERNKQEKNIMKSSLVNSFEDINILKMPTKFHDVLLYVNYLDKVYANYVSFGKFCSKIGYGSVFFEGNDWRPTKDTQKVMGAIKSESSINEMKEFIEAEYLNSEEYNRLWKSDKTKKQSVALLKTYIAKAIGRDQLDTLLKSGMELTLRDIKALPEQLSNYLLKDDTYKLNLLQYKAKYLPEWDKNTEKLAINLLMGDVKKMDFDQVCEFTDFVHGMCHGKINSEFDEEQLNSMIKKCINWRKNNKKSYASVKMGDTISIEKFQGLNVDATTHESMGEGKFSKLWDGQDIRLLNGILSKCGYYMDKRRVRRNGQRVYVHTLITDPAIASLIACGSVEYINRKLKPYDEVEIKWDNTEYEV